MEVKAKFAIVSKNGSCVQLFNERPSAYYYTKIIENVSINKLDDVFELKGELYQVKFSNWTTTKNWVNDTDQIKNDSIEYGYKNLIDRIRKIKKPYVKSWYWLKENEPYHVYTTEITISGIQHKI